MLCLQVHKISVLTTGVSSIHHNIRPGCICACVARQVQVHPLEFPRVRISPQRREPIPFILHLYRTIAADDRVDVSRADAVDPGETSPLYSQRFGEVDYSGFTGIVASLFLSKLTRTNRVWV